MAQILVRNMDHETLERLKAQAKGHGRSLQSEVKIILVEAADMTVKEVRAVSGRWQQRLSGRRTSDSAVLIREDRTR